MKMDGEKKRVDMYDNRCNNCVYFRCIGHQLFPDVERYCDKLLCPVKAGDKICHGFKYRHVLDKDHIPKRKDENGWDKRGDDNG